MLFSDWVILATRNIISVLHAMAAVCGKEA